MVQSLILKITGFQVPKWVLVSFPLLISFITLVLTAQSTSTSFTSHYISPSTIDKEWPLTVDYGHVYCEKGAYIVFKDPSGRMYSVNGLAKSNLSYPSIDLIWKDNPSPYIPKIDISPIIEFGQQFCY